MLTDVGRHVRIAVSQPPDGFNYRLRFNLAALRVVLQAVTRAPLFNLLPPVADFIQRLLGLLVFEQLQHLFQHQAGVANDRHVGRHRLGYRSRIDIDMQYRRVRTVPGQIICRTIVEAHANGENHVGIVHGHVGFISAMHAQHPQRLLVRCRKGAEPHQRRRHRQLQLLNQCIQLRFTLGVNRPAADIHHRFFCRYQRLQRTFNLPFMARRRRVIRAHANRIRPDVRQFFGRIEDIFR